MNFPDPEYSVKEESILSQMDISVLESSNSIFDALNTNMQTYFKEAVETYEVKIYELSLICTESTHTFYFCCRVELGCESAYYDTNWDTKNMSGYDEEILLFTQNGGKITRKYIQDLQMKVKDWYENSEDPSTFQATIKVNKMDPIQKEYSSNDEAAYNRDIRMSYLKVISVPTISDINYNDSDPNANHLILDYIDWMSYDIEQQELEAEKDKVKMAKVEKLYEALKSIHVYLHVGELSILFGKVRLLIFRSSVSQEESKEETERDWGGKRGNN